MTDEEKQMNEAFYFLATKKREIKLLVVKYKSLQDVMDIIEIVYKYEYADHYHSNNSLFNAINETEFYDWCKENIKNFVGGVCDAYTHYWCDIAKNNGEYNTYSIPILHMRKSYDL